MAEPEHAHSHDDFEGLSMGLSPPVQPPSASNVCLFVQRDQEAEDRVPAASLALALPLYLPSLKLVLNLAGTLSLPVSPRLPSSLACISAALPVSM